MGLAIMLALVGPPAGAGVTQKAAAVPESFRAAVARETAAGLRLEETREATAGGARYLAAVFSYPEAHKERSGFKALRLYRAAEGRAALEAAASLDEEVLVLGTFDEPETVFADVNRDGTTDLVVTAGNMGNCWNCSRAFVYALEPSGARLLAAAPMTLRDLDGDGALELLVGDTRWEFYDDFSHAGSPGGTLVYVWRDGRYVFAGSEAAAFYERAAEALRAQLPDAIRSVKAKVPFSDEQYLQVALSLYLISVYMGEGERGREELRRMLGEHAADADMRERRKRILEDFLSGESARKLAETRPGAPHEPTLRSNVD